MGDVDAVEDAAGSRVWGAGTAGGDVDAAVCAVYEFSAAVDGDEAVYLVSATEEVVAEDGLFVEVASGLNVELCRVDMFYPFLACDVIWCEESMLEAMPAQVFERDRICIFLSDRLLRHDLGRFDPDQA